MFVWLKRVFDLVGLGCLVVNLDFLICLFFVELCVNMCV